MCGKAIHIITASRVWEVVPNHWNKKHWLLHFLLLCFTNFFAFKLAVLRRIRDTRIREAEDGYFAGTLLAL
jgi:hypothetical protein